jgi:hypothetical protein
LRVLEARFTEVRRAVPKKNHEDTADIAIFDIFT